MNGIKGSLSVNSGFPVDVSQLDTQKKMTTGHLLLFLVSYTLLFAILFPGYRFLIRSDDTGYLNVAEKIATGHYFESINGIWSPLGSWILVPFLKLGFDGIIVSKLLNGFYGLLSLCSFFFLLKKVKVQFYIQLTMMACSVVLILHFAFDRMFGDFLQVTILLIYLNIICSKNFGRNYFGIILAAIAGSIGFYAKAYTFYFILLHLPITLIITEKTKMNADFPKRTFRKIFIALAVFLSVSLFWLMCLNLKYGKFILGQKNITGTLRAIYKPVRRIAAPPIPGNYSFVDDITTLYHTDVTPFTNWHLFITQSKIFIYNFYDLLQAFNEFSVLFSVILLVVLTFILSKCGFFIKEKNNLILSSVVLIWPAGFLFFSIQSRFLWITDLIALVLAGILLTRIANLQILKTKTLIFVCFLVTGSFFLYPLLELKNTYGAGKEIFETASSFRKNNIRGNMLMGGTRTSFNISDAVSLNYLIHSKFYGVYSTDYTNDEILKVIKEYNINYFVFYYSQPAERENFLSGAIASSADKKYENIFPGVIVLSFNERAH